MSNQTISFIILFILLLNFIFIVLSIKKIPKNNFLKKYFFNFLIIGFFWLLSNFITLYFLSEFFLKLSYALGAFAYVSYLLFVLSFANKTDKIKKEYLFYIIGFIFFTLSIIPNFFLTIQIVNNDFVIKTSNFFILYILGILFCLIFSISKFIYCVKNFKGFLKIQAEYSLVGASLFATFSFCFSFILPSLGYIEFAKLDVCAYLFFVGFTFYAIAAHRLMDIDLAWRKAAKKIIYYAILILYILNIVYFLNSHNFTNFQEIIMISSLTSTMDKPKMQFRF